ncbi:MAG: spondin domain-containing protein [Acidobacteriota bacterium]
MRRLTPALFALALLLAVAGAAQAQDTSADCTLTFDAIWSAATHPTDFPPGAHFSPLIGGSHSDQVSFWAPGGTATAGIQAMAETGATTPLRNEVLAAMQAGTAAAVISGGSVDDSPGSALANFSLEVGHPLVTVVTMIAPSPDWFVGLHGLPLFDEGHWIETVEVPLPPYDAGTDSGVTFSSLDDPTNPQGVITQITTHPFLGGTSLGTFTITCASALIFMDGFESGDLTIWSASTS